MKPVVIFWDSPGYRVGDLDSKAELSGPFVDRYGLHEAFRWADSRGFTVTDVTRTRGLIKPRQYNEKEQEQHGN